MFSKISSEGNELVGIFPKRHINLMRAILNHNTIKQSKCYVCFIGHLTEIKLTD